MKKILVGLDFSAASQNAFEYALLLARDIKAELVLLHTYLPIRDHGDYPEEIIEFTRKNEKDRAAEKLKKLTVFYPNKDEEKFLKHNVSIQYLVKEGVPVPTILKTALELEADLIISGAKSGGQLTKLILGSITRELINKATLPILLIPDNYSYNGIREIAYATNLEGKDEEAFNWVNNFGKIVKAQVHSFNVSLMPYDFSRSKEEEWPSKYLPRVNGVPTRVRIIRDASFQSGVKYYLSAHPSDILAMFVPNRSMLNQFFHISKTQQMVLNNRLPVLIYHA